MFGKIRIAEFMRRSKGVVEGQQLSDAKIRSYGQEYEFSIGSNETVVQKSNGTGEQISFPNEIPLDETLVAFFGLYSGDGAKGSEDKRNPGTLKPAISFCQVEPNLIKFATKQFKLIFGEQIRFVYSLGEDTAFFMAGLGLNQLRVLNPSAMKRFQKLEDLQATLSVADQRYLAEFRNGDLSNEQCLAFYYENKEAMARILVKKKCDELAKNGIVIGPNDRVTASLRRPFKKGARELGGSSRADEIHVGGVNGMGELFLKIMHEVETSIVDDVEESESGLIEWNGKPSYLGTELDVLDFFKNDPYGCIGGERPITKSNDDWIVGKWPRSKEVRVKQSLLINPNFAFFSGLYMAEGSTSKHTFFKMYRERPQKLSLSFTSSEDVSLAITLNALRSLFPQEDCVATWKIKVGSQYFSELVAIGLKHGVPMLRGGKSGDGKCRTIEISLDLIQWALDVCPSIQPFERKFSHVEPTGAGVARLDFSASSTFCKWLFPIIVYVMFQDECPDPSSGFDG